MRKLRNSLRLGRRSDEGPTTSIVPAPPESYSPGAVAADFYVDSVAGSDGNAGTSSGAAFATIARLLTEDLTGGVTVGLACGSHWREKLVAVDSLTILGYGTGPLPVLDCSNVQTGWTKTSGRTNIYEITIATEVGQDFNSSFVHLYEDDVALWRADDLDDLDAAAGLYYVPQDATSPTTVYVHASNGGNPGNNGSTYEVSVRQYGINAFQKDNVTVRHVECRNQLANNGSAAFGRNADIRYCIFRNGGKHNLYVGSNALIRDVWLYESYYTATSTMLVINEDVALTGTVVVQDCFGVRSSYGNGAPDAFINSHNNVSGSFGALELVDCECWNLRDFLSNCGSFDTVAVTRPVLREVAQVCGYVTDAVHTITDLDWRQTVNEIGDGFVVLEETTLNLVGGRAEFSNPKNAFVYVTSASTIDLDSLTLDCRRAFGMAGRRAIFATGAVLLSAENVIFQDLAEVYRLSVEPASLDSDLNCFSDGLVNFYRNGITYTTVSQWQTTGQDVNSTVGGC